MRLGPRKKTGCVFHNTLYIIQIYLKFQRTAMKIAEKTIKIFFWDVLQR